MKKAKQYIFLLFLCTILSACRIDALWLLDSEDKLIIQSHKTGEISTAREIAKGEKTYSRIKEWMEQHEKGWEPSPASYVPGVEVRGKKFVLNFIPGGAVLNFRTPDGKYHQYVKEISESEFLYLFQYLMQPSGFSLFSTSQYLQGGLRSEFLRIKKYSLK